jgi:hypothetical protein
VAAGLSPARLRRLQPHRACVVDATMTCETCHGNVRELTEMQKLKDTSMAACMACHTEMAAPTRCDSCHESK